MIVELPFALNFVPPPSLVGAGTPWPGRPWTRDFGDSGEGLGSGVHSGCLPLPAIQVREVNGGAGTRGGLLGGTLP